MRNFKPFNRAYLRSRGIANLNDVENHDDCWCSLLNAMTHPSLQAYKFAEVNDTTSSFGTMYAKHGFVPVGSHCDVPSLKLKNILKISLPNPNTGVSNNIT